MTLYNMRLMYLKGHNTVFTCSNVRPCPINSQYGRTLCQTISETLYPPLVPHTYNGRQCSHEHWTYSPQPIHITSSNVTSSSHGSLHTNTHALTHQSHTSPHTSASISEATQIHTMHLHLASMFQCTQYSTHRSLPQPTHITRIHITKQTLH